MKNRLTANPNMVKGLHQNLLSMWIVVHAMLRAAINCIKWCTLGYGCSFLISSKPSCNTLPAGPVPMLHTVG